MNPFHEKVLEYIKNTGGSPLIKWFDEDWDPIGERLRNDMKKEGLIIEKDDKVFIAPNQG